MTEEEIKRIAELVAEKDREGYKRKTKRKGLFAKVIVTMCILLAVGYTGICLLMQWRTGTQPEPQLTIVFFSFITVELWNLAKIKQSKRGREKDDA